MKQIKFIFTSILFLFLTASSAPADVRTYKNEFFFLSVSSSPAAYPGDACFVRMTVRQLKKRKVHQDTSAVLILMRNNTKIDSAHFFNISPEKKNLSDDLLAGIPLSTYLNPKDSYMLKIVMSVPGADPVKFELPLTIAERKFTEEKIELNEANTGIKTDTSPERLSQIDRLNTILTTITPADVFTIRPFVCPVPAATRHSSDFGDRRIYLYTSGKTSTSLHYGIDYAVPQGTIIRACGDGRVVMAENRISTGWSVAIEHAPGLYSLYYHMKELSVKKGQMVKSGNKIGLSGSTGLSTGPHLHWEIRLNAAAVSPEFFTADYAYSEN